MTRKSILLTVFLAMLLLVPTTVYASELPEEGMVGEAVAVAVTQTDSAPDVDVEPEIQIVEHAPESIVPADPIPIPEATPPQEEVAAETSDTEINVSTPPDMGVLKGPTTAPAMHDTNVADTVADVHKDTLEPEVKRASVVNGQEVFENGQWKFLKNDGAYAVGLVRLPDGRVVYYGVDNAMKTGSQSINGMPYQFDVGNGNISQTGEVYIDGKGWAYLDPSRIEYVKDSFKTLPDGRTVYYDKNGFMQFGDYQINSYSPPHRFDSATGVLQTGEIYFEGIGWTHLDGMHYYTRGFYKQNDGRVVYYDYATYAMVFGTKELNGMPYSFDPGHGGLQTGEVYIENRGWTYLNPNNRLYEKGIKTLEDGRIVYYGENYGMQTGELTINGMPYIFSGDNGSLINLGENYIDGKGWAYLHPNYAQYISGLVTLSDGRTVLYGSDNIMMFGDVVWNGQPFRLDMSNGRVQTGELYFDGRGWTYRDPNEINICASGFVTLSDGRLVNYNPSTYAMETKGAFVYFGDTYYANDDGNILRGWFEFDDGSRYFDLETGKMFSGWHWWKKDLWLQFAQNGIYLAESNLDPSEAYSVLDYVNSERASQGRSVLKMDNFMMGLAMDRAYEIISNFAHVRPDGRSWDTIFSDYGFNIYWTYIGENIASGYDTAASVMLGWMGSEGHRANILNSSYTHMGVGLYADSNGRKYWVQLFGAAK